MNLFSIPSLGDSTNRPIDGINKNIPLFSLTSFALRDFWDFNGDSSQLFNELLNNMTIVKVFLNVADNNTFIGELFIDPVEKLLNNVSKGSIFAGFWDQSTNGLTWK